MFLPVLTDASSNPPGEARRFAQAVGVRTELTPAVFTLSDALAFVHRIEKLYGEKVTALTSEQLRNQINPAYQHLFELLSGAATTRQLAADVVAALRQAHLLVHDGHDRHRFAVASETLYAPRGGLREILGIEGELWTFVLEGRPAVRAPLERFFGARDLDEVLDWQPQTDEQSLDEAGLEQFREGLREVAPYLLARLRAERSEEDQATRDASLLREFIERVEPVQHLTASCALDGFQLVAGGVRQAFVERKANSLVAYVRWGENPWPPDPGEAEALATAITELLGVGYFEPLLALLTAEPSGRARLLHLAGASDKLDSARDAMALHEPPTTPPDDNPPLPPPTDGDSVDRVNDAPAGLGAPAATTPARVKLVELESLSFDGDPIIEPGKAPGETGTRARRHSVLGQRGASQAARSYGGGTDLDKLNRVGMFVARAFEERRLIREGVMATIFDAIEPVATDAVFDVSSAMAIAEAAESSTRFREALVTLTRYGISTVVPGFDILTLDERFHDDLGRLIELKSSGVNARTQAMTWNEWKTAGHAELRTRFYLYLVGNLRADTEGPPFVRTIRDPFGALRATELSDRTLRRSVQLDVTAFEQAEFQQLLVQSDDPRSGRTYPE